MGKLEGQHEISTLGQCQNVTTGASAARLTLSSDPSGAGPEFFLVMCDEDVIVRQGDSTVAATTSDPILWKKTTAKITVENADQAYLSYRQRDTSGTLQVWRCNSDTPGDGAST